MWKREKHFSALLSAQGIDHIYLPGSRFFKLSSGEKYTPDFYLPKRRIYVEVVGSRQAYHSNKKKYELFQRDFPTLKIIFVTMDGKTFTASTRKEFDWKLIDYVGIFLSLSLIHI